MQFVPALRLPPRAGVLSSKIQVRASPRVNAAEDQAEPVYTLRALSVVFQYNAPVIRPSPSLSTDGSEALSPRYLSSKSS